jgi:hypothetical protein
METTMTGTKQSFSVPLCIPYAFPHVRARIRGYTGRYTQGYILAGQRPYGPIGPTPRNLAICPIPRGGPNDHRNQTSQATPAANGAAKTSAWHGVRTRAGVMCKRHADRLPPRR